MDTKDFIEQFLKLMKERAQDCSECKDKKDDQEKEFEYEIDEEEFEKEMYDLPFWVDNYDSAKKHIARLEASIMTYFAILTHIRDRGLISPEIADELSKIRDVHDETFKDIIGRNKF